jgi:hypothetical protein
MITSVKRADLLFVLFRKDMVSKKNNPAGFGFEQIIIFLNPETRSIFVRDLKTLPYDQNISLAGDDR